MAHLSVSLMGPLEIRSDGEPIAQLRSSKGRALLAYLTAEAERSHPRNALAALLWPELSHRDARRNLRRVLSNLRKAIGDRPPSGDQDSHSPLLLVTRETIQFNSSSDAWVDVRVFRSLLSKPESGRGVTGQLEKAIALYRGPFLEGFSLSDSVPFDDWSILTGERLRHEFLVALERLTVLYELQGQLGHACDMARRQVTLEPWQEGAHRELMRLLALRGERAEALAEFEACRHTLMAELGVEPARETTTLYERIRDGAALPSPSRGPPHNLPSALFPFVGREGLLAEVAHHLRDPSCRLLGLVGPGGCGKTRVALEAAARCLGEFRHGVFFVSLAAIQSVDAIAPTISETLNFPLTSGTDIPPQQQLLDYLREKQMLLILDNFEHLLAGVGLVAQILRWAPDVKIITTSRVRLNARGEHLVAVPGMDVPPLDARVPLSEYPAVQLFVQSARRVRADFKPTAVELDQATHICRGVEGMPLAILIAASWVGLLRTKEIADQISSHSLDFLETQWRDVPERQRSMHAVFDHSWSLLSEREREVFVGLSVFRGGCAIEAAQEITGASLRELASLVDRSLLQRTANGRFEMHELVRQYAEERLAEIPLAAEALRKRHCVCYAGALEGWEAELRGLRQGEALVEMAADLDNARGAWEWAVARGNMGCLAQAIDGLSRFYERQGRFQEGETVCRLATDRLQSMKQELGEDGLRLLVHILAWRGLHNRIMGHTELSRGLLQQALSLLGGGPLGEAATRRERAFALEQLGHAVRRSDYEMAHAHWQESLALYRALGDTWAVANVLAALSIRHLDLGETARAEAMLQESLRIRRSLGDHTGIADALIGLSYVAKQSDRYEDTENLAREAAAIRRAIGDRAGLGEALRMVGVGLIIQGRFAEARDVKAEAVALRQDLGMRTELTTEMHGLAFTKTLLGEYQEARELEMKSLALAQAVSSPLTYNLVNLAEISLAEGSYDEAHDTLQQVMALVQDTRCDEYRIALATLAQVELALGRPVQARRHLREALAVAHRWGTLMAYLTWLPRMALFLVSEGEIERAVELYALAKHFPLIGNSRFWEDIAGKHIVAAAAALPPGAIAVAEERGRARDLKATIEELLIELDVGQAADHPTGRAELFESP